MFVRFLGRLRNGASARVAEAHGGEVQGGSLLRITNQRGFVVSPVAFAVRRWLWPKRLFILTLPEDWVRRRHCCAPAMWRPRVMVNPCSHSDGPGLRDAAGTSCRRRLVVRWKRTASTEYSQDPSQTFAKKKYLSRPKRQLAMPVAALAASIYYLYTPCRYPLPSLTISFPGR